MKLIISKTVLASLVAIAVSQADAAKLYKWVDDKGNISYQDQPPPKSGKILSEKEVGSSSDNKSKVDEGLPKVVVYSVDACELCDRLISVLRKDKVPHIVLPLADDRAAQSKILEKASSIIAPSIFIGDDIVQGGTEDSLRDKLRLAGFDISDSTESSKSRLR